LAVLDNFLEFFGLYEDSFHFTKALAPINFMKKQNQSSNLAKSPNSAKSPQEQFWGCSIGEEHLNHATQIDSGCNKD